MTNRENVPNPNSYDDLLDTYHLQGLHFDDISTRFTAQRSGRLTASLIVCQETCQKICQPEPVRSITFDARSLSSWLALADHAGVETVDTRLINAVPWVSYVELSKLYLKRYSLIDLPPTVPGTKKHLMSILSNMRPGFNLMLDHMPRPKLRLMKEAVQAQTTVPHGTMAAHRTLLPDLSDTRISQQVHEPSDMIARFQAVRDIQAMKIDGPRSSYKPYQVPVIWRFFISNNEITGASMLLAHRAITETEAWLTYQCDAARHLASTILETMRRLRLIPINSSLPHTAPTREYPIDCTLDVLIAGNGKPLLRDGAPGCGRDSSSHIYHCNFGTAPPVGIALCQPRA
jgi:hypothetical protein